MWHFAGRAAGVFLYATTPHIARHVQFAAVLIRNVLKPALPINVPRPHIDRIDRKPNPLEAEFLGKIDADADQLGSDAEILEFRTNNH